MHAENRMINDVVSSIIGHGLATRFPDLRFMPVENGSSWVRPLVERLQKVYERSPKVFDEDPMETFTRSIYVHPFHEEDPVGLVRLIGADNVLFGSDYPHPEGMYDPIGFVDQLDGLSEEDKAKVMGGNLTRVMKVAA
jgi:predicted TIM-barrel fold metal-dependent hydrolase